MNNITMIFLSLSVVFFMAGIILFYKEKTKEKAAKFDEDYAEKLRRVYFDTGTIEDTFTRLLAEYDGNRYMCSLLESAIEYLYGDYGDYETALGIINVNQEDCIRAVNEEVLSADMAKRRALPIL